MRGGQPACIQLSPPVLEHLVWRASHTDMVILTLTAYGTLSLHRRLARSCVFKVQRQMSYSASLSMCSNRECSQLLCLAGLTTLEGCKLYRRLAPRQRSEERGRCSQVRACNAAPPDNSTVRQFGVLHTDHTHKAIAQLSTVFPQTTETYRTAQTITTCR